MLDITNLSLRNLLVKGRRKWEGVPASPPHNKTPSHSREQASEMSEQSSQIKVKRIKKNNPRESRATKQTKIQGPHSEQNTASCKQRRIENDSSEAWHCFMCSDIVKEDMIKCQMRLRWARRAGAGFSLCG